MYSQTPPPAPGTPAPYSTGAQTWGDEIRLFFQDPVGFAQDNLVWIVVLLLSIFLLSRTNNILEIRGVNRAISISRGLVSSFTAYILAPIMGIILLNVIAAAKGLPSVDMSFIWDWLKLTLGTFLWLGQCLFNSADIERMQHPFDGNSIIRILWVILPLAFVWIRTARSNVGKMLLIPFVLVVLWVTQYKVAQPTFLTPFLEQHYPEWFGSPAIVSIEEAPKPGSGLNIPLQYDTERSVNGTRAVYEKSKSGVLGMYRQHNQKIILGLGGVLFAGLFIGLYLKKTMLGGGISLGALAVFYVLETTVRGGWHPTGRGSDDRLAELDTLVATFVREHNQPLHNDLKLTHLSIAINNRYKAEELNIPDSLCAKYKNYFYELCEQKGK